MNPSHKVAVIVISYNTRDLLLECLSSIMRSTSAADAKIVVVDNASRDQSAEAVREAYPEVTIIRNQSNLGFGAACNQGIRATDAPLILLLNSDARLTDGAFIALCEAVTLNDRCGAAGCRIVTAGGLPTPNTRNFLTPINQALELLGVTGPLSPRYLKRTYRPTVDGNQLDCSVDWIDGACLMLRRTALDEVGLFDERFFMYSEDEDLCLRLRNRDWRVCYSSRGSAVHHGGASALQNKSEMLRQFYASQILLLAKHRGGASAQLYFVAMKVVLFFKRLISGNEERRKQSAERLQALSQAWSLRSSAQRHTGD